jgi:acyl carrier protein
MTIEQIIENIHHILVSDFEIEPGRITPDARLREDLELDSLDAVDLVVSLESAFGVHVDAKAITELKTIGDIHAYVCTLVVEREDPRV